MFWFWFFSRSPSCVVLFCVFDQKLLFFFFAFLLSLCVCSLVNRPSFFFCDAGVQRVTICGVFVFVLFYSCFCLFCLFFSPGFFRHVLVSMIIFMWLCLPCDLFFFGSSHHVRAYSAVPFDHGT